MSWEDYDRAADRGPFALGLKVIFLFIGLSIVIGFLGYGMGWFAETAKVTQEEFGPRAMLQKYEWFKDAAAQLDKKQADVAVFEGRMKNMSADYKGVPRNKWPRDDREQYNVWSSEVAGVKASFNQLAAEYNSAMAKFNYAFANVGTLPRGAETPLPREFKTYVTE